MRQLDLNKVTNLSQLREEFDKAINRKIEQIELTEAIENIPNLSLSELISLFESMSCNLMNKKDGRKVIKEYITFLRESSAIKNVLKLDNFVKTNSISSNADILLNEAINCCRIADKKTYDIERGKLSEIIVKSIKNENISKAQIDEAIAAKNATLDSIIFLTLNKKSLKNLNEYVENFNIVSSLLSENKKSTMEVETSSIDDVNEVGLMDELNSSINELSETWEKNLAKDLVLSSLSGNKKSEIFEEYKQDCLEIIDEIIKKDIDTITKSNVNSMMEGLKNKNYSEDTFITDILNLAELKETLNETWEKD